MRLEKKELGVMATSSIYTSVKIKNKDACKRLVGALENAKEVKIRDVEFSRPVKEIKGSAIKEIFSAKR